MLLIAVVVITMMWGCGSSNTPRAVAEKSLEYLKDKKYDKYVKLVYFDEEAQGKTELLKEKQESMQDLIQNKYNMSIQQNGSIKDFKFVEEEVKDSTASVKFDISYSSGKTDTQKVKLRMLPSGDWKIDMRGK